MTSRPLTRLAQTLQSSTKPFKVVMAHHTTGGVPGVCGCGVPDLDANGAMECQEPSGCSGQCTCSGATLRSDDADGVGRVGATITWTAGATCSGGTAQYQFRTR